MRSITFTVLIFLVVAALSEAQSPHPGVALFEAERYSDAIVSLKSASESKVHRSDPVVWNYLGRSYLATGDFKKARKALEKSVQLDPSNSLRTADLALLYVKTGDIRKARATADKAVSLDTKNPRAYEVRAIAEISANALENAERDADTLLQLEPAKAEAYLLKSDVFLAKLRVAIANGGSIRENASYLERGLRVLEAGLAVEEKIAPTTPSRILPQLETVAAFYSFSTTTSPDSAADNVIPCRLLNHPAARYTDAARTGNVMGSVRLAVLLPAKDQEAVHVLLLRGLEPGLDAQAIAAAKLFRFVPKLKNGIPEPCVLTVDYEFSIY